MADARGCWGGPERSDYPAPLRRLRGFASSVLGRRDGGEDDRGKRDKRKQSRLDAAIYLMKRSSPKERLASGRAFAVWRSGDYRHYGNRTGTTSRTAKAIFEVEHREISAACGKERRRAKLELPVALPGRAAGVHRAMPTDNGKTPTRVMRVAKGFDSAHALSIASNRKRTRQEHSWACALSTKRLK